MREKRWTSAACFQGAIISAAVALSLAAAYLLLFHTGPSGKTPGEADSAAQGRAHVAEPRGPEPGINVRIQKTEITHFKSGKIAWSLQADEVQSHSGTGVTELRNVLGKLYRGEVSILEFRTARAGFDDRSRTGTADGGVACSLQPEGFSLSAPSLKWDERGSLLSLSGGVRADFDGGTVRADEALVDGNLNLVRFSRGVVLELPLP
ncbi:MAG: hypothetical protein AB1742_06830 [bacterium]